MVHEYVARNGLAIVKSLRRIRGPGFLSRYDDHASTSTRVVPCSEGIFHPDAKYQICGHTRVHATRIVAHKLKVSCLRSICS